MQWCCAGTRRRECAQRRALLSAPTVWPFRSRANSRPQVGVLPNAGCTTHSSMSATHRHKHVLQASARSRGFGSIGPSFRTSVTCHGQPELGSQEDIKQSVRGLVPMEPRRLAWQQDAVQGNACLLPLFRGAMQWVGSWKQCVRPKPKLAESHSEAQRPCKDNAMARAKHTDATYASDRTLCKQVGLAPSLHEESPVAKTTNETKGDRRIVRSTSCSRPAAGSRTNSRRHNQPGLRHCNQTVRQGHPPA